jgi:hypothetical protein
MAEGDHKTLSDAEHIVVFKEKTETSHTLDLAKIEINIVEAQNLINKDLLSKSDPYVIFQIFDKHVKTIVIQDDLNPKWGARFTVLIAHPHKEDVDLKFIIMDEDMLKDDYLGQVTIKLSTLKATKGVVDNWYPIDVKGSLHLVIQTQAISSIDEDTHSKNMIIQKEQEKQATMQVSMQTVLHELEVTKKLRNEDQLKYQGQLFQLQNTYDATAKALAEATAARDHYRKELTEALKENETLKKKQPEKPCCIVQ